LLRVKKTFSNFHIFGLHVPTSQFRRCSCPCAEIEASGGVLQGEVEKGFTALRELMASRERMLVEQASGVAAGRLGVCKLQRERASEAEAGMAAALSHGDAALDEGDPEDFLRAQKTFEVKVRELREGGAFEVLDETPGSEDLALTFDAEGIAAELKRLLTITQASNGGQWAPSLEAPELEAVAVEREKSEEGTPGVGSDTNHKQEDDAMEGDVKFEEGATGTEEPSGQASKGIDAVADVAAADDPAVADTAVVVVEEADEDAVAGAIDNDGDANAAASDEVTVGLEVRAGAAKAESADAGLKTSHHEALAAAVAAAASAATLAAGALAAANAATIAAEDTAELLRSQLEARESEVMALQGQLAQEARAAGRLSHELASSRRAVDAAQTSHDAQMGALQASHDARVASIEAGATIPRAQPAVKAPDNPSSTKP
jgi:hypothetical protein